MAEIEGDSNLSTEGVMRKRADVAREVLAELGKLMQPAECAAGRRKEKLDEKIDAFLNTGKAKDIAAAQIASEIRAHVAGSEVPAMTALKLKDNKQAIAAILAAPAFLSGLTEQEASTFRTHVLSASEEFKEAREIESALTVCRVSIKSAEAMIAKRAQVRQNSLNGSEIP